MGVVLHPPDTTLHHSSALYTTRILGMDDVLSGQVPAAAGGLPQGEIASLRFVDERSGVVGGPWPVMMLEDLCGFHEFQCEYECECETWSGTSYDTVHRLFQQRRSIVTDFSDDCRE